jgi:hypothetical protein
MWVKKWLLNIRPGIISNRIWTDVHKVFWTVMKYCLSEVRSVYMTCLKIWIRKKIEKVIGKKIRNFFAGFEPNHFQGQCDFTTQIDEDYWNADSTIQFWYFQLRYLQ